MAEDSLLEVIAGVIATLKAAPAVSALVGAKVYSDVPHDEAMPYLVVGQMTTQVPFAQKDAQGDSIALTIEAWSDKASILEAAQVMQAARQALNRNNTISLSSHQLVDVNWEYGSIGRELDGVSWHALHRYRVDTVPL